MAASSSVSETVERKEACRPPRCRLQAGPVVMEPAEGDRVPPEPCIVPSACPNTHTIPTSAQAYSPFRNVPKMDECRK